MYDDEEDEELGKEPSSCLHRPFSVWLREHSRRVISLVTIAVLIFSVFILSACVATGACSGSADESLPSSDPAASCRFDCKYANWNYQPAAGPHCWGNCYRKCRGSAQSPINLDTAKTTHVDVRPLTMKGYDTPSTYTAVNNGHTLYVNIIGSENRIEGLGLPSTYAAIEFHFHWGDSSNKGSEHTINNRAYPMELHIVHYNTRYDSLSEALTEPDGLAVLGFMFTVSPEDNPAFDFIIEKVPRILYKKGRGRYNEVTLSSQRLRDLLPKNLTYFYLYAGSLTRPPCKENVFWAIFTNTIDISEYQLITLRSMFASYSDDAEVPLYNNYRPPQARNGRRVLFGVNG